MRRVNLLKSTPFRLALIFAALSIASFLGTGLVTYHLLRNDLADRLDRSIQEDFSVLSSSYGDGDLPDLLDTINSHVAPSVEQERIYLLLSSDGRKLAGNIEAQTPVSGWSTVSSSALGIRGDNQYRVYAGKVDSRPLLVGVSFEESAEVLDVVRTSFGWAAALALAIAATAGAALALRIQRRMEAIASTMREVGTGKFDTRIPLSGNGDDIDQLSSQVNDAIGRLSDLVEGMRQVSTDIAHDLKTPLQRLSLLIDEVSNDSGHDRKISSKLLKVRDEAIRINGTFDALLRIAQIEAGARRSRFSLIDMRECLETIAEVYTDVAEDLGHTLLVNLQSGADLRIVGDKELVVQLFANLVENSIRHSPQGSVIEIEAEFRESALVVEIKDNGPGIPEAERDKVFRRLYRLDKSRTTPGTGLGLSLVKAIVELHGAYIDLRDTKPGLVVAVRFP